MNVSGRNPQSAVSIEEFARLQTTSRLARTGQRLIQTAQIITAFESLITVIAVAALWCFAFPLAAHAQTTNGEIFGNDQQIGNAIREAVKWGRNLLFVMGIVFIGWAVMNYGNEKPASKQIIAGLGCFAFGGIVALVYSISQGTAVNFDTGFGN